MSAAMTMYEACLRTVHVCLFLEYMSLNKILRDMRGKREYAGCLITLPRYLGT